jgi:hypothetical protein
VSHVACNGGIADSVPPVGPPTTRGFDRHLKRSLVKPVRPEASALFHLAAGLDVSSEP